MALKLHGWILARPVAAVMLVFAFANNSYSYYKLLRWTVCSVAAYSALKAAEMNKRGWVWSFGISADLFNPIFPVHLSGEIWVSVDLVLANMVCISVFIIKH